MNFFKKIVLLGVIAVFVQCTTKDSFVIEKGKVGMVNSKTTIKDMYNIFERDSVVSNLAPDEELNENSFFFGNDEYEIYSEKGTKLLEIVPIKVRDSFSTIKSVQIFNPEYKTEKNIGLNSTFKEISENYTIDKVETTLSSATLYIDELNATIAIDKEEIGVSKFSSNEISLEDIPGNSHVKYFTIWFN